MSTRAAATGGATDSEPANFPALFSPLQLSGHRLRNRVVHASISTKMACAQRTTPLLLDYYRSRARGGAAMIVTEPLSVLPWHRLAHKVNVFGEHGHEDLSSWADAVESFDCRLLGQLQDPGRGRHSHVRNPDAVGPSALPDDLSWTVPHVLAIADIERLIERMVEAASRLQAAGFSGVEISAGHGHLFHQFLSAWSNRRDDRYGGDLEGRTRLLAELTAGLRTRCGGRFIIGLKLPGMDGVPGSIDIDEAARIASRLARTGIVDYVCFAQGSHADSLHMHIPDMTGPRCPYTAITRTLRQAANGVPVMALGLITDPAEAEQLVASGVAELVGLGRALIADPSWPDKAIRGRSAEIRYCVSCNSCWGTTAEQGRPVACDNNPRVGLADEVEWQPRKTHRALRVTIVGAGPAGLEAAWTAAARGHQVTLFGSSGEVGGKLRLRCALPGGENLSSVYDYQYLMARRHGVRLELGVRVTLAELRTMQPDALVLASGATMAWPDELHADYHAAGAILDLRSTMQQFTGRMRHECGTAVVLDRDHSAGTYAAADRLSDLFDRVVIVTPRESLAQAEPLVTRQVIYKRLASRKIDVMLLSSAVPDLGLDEARLNLRHRYSGAASSVEDVALVTYSNYRVPDIGLLAGLADFGGRIHVIGDAHAPQPLMAATQSGYALGITL